jgi:hypothetical protein
MWARPAASKWVSGEAVVGSGDALFGRDGVEGMVRAS